LVKPTCRESANESENPFAQILPSDLGGSDFFRRASATVCPALDGASPLRINTFNGWKVFGLVTQNNDISAFDDLGYSVGGTVNRGTLDGLGIYASGNSMSIILNRETSAAAIRRVEVDVWLRGYPGVAGFLPTPKNAS
jgi:hypothetical protein